MYLHPAAMTTKRSIAFVCHPYHRGGVTRWMADAAIAAAAAGCTVYFVAPEPASPFFSAGGRETMLSLLQPHSGQLRIISRRVGYTFEFGTEAYRAAIYAALITRHIPAGVPLVISDDDAIWQGACSAADRYPVTGVLHGDQDYYYNKARKHHRQLSACVCVSRRIARNLLAGCPDIDKTKVATIPCGINLPAYNPAPPVAGLLRLAFIGRLTDYEKRAEDLTAICAALRDRGCSFHLHIAGNSDSSATAFAALFKAQGVGENVTFHGWQARPQVQQLLDATDVALLTSNSEGMPLVMMEALASGCAFTGTRVSGIEDFEHDTRAADCLTVYAVGDVADAAAKILAIAAVPAAQRQQSARRLAETEFSMQVCLERYFTAIDRPQSAPIAAVPVALTATGMLRSRLIALARYLKVALMSRK